MYSQNSNTSMAPPQKPETFMLSSEAQQSLPHDAQIALNQVDNRTSCHGPRIKDRVISVTGANETRSEVLSHISTCRLDARSVYPEISPAHWRIRVLRLMVSLRRRSTERSPLLTNQRNNLFHISGTDIVRCLSFRFQAFGRPVKNSKKFEEGIFSDLRNLKSGTDASLEEPKSAFLDFMYKNNCIRTQKKQKVFYWYSVPHDRLFLDALERDLKREKMGQEATTVAVNEPALSFEFDSSQSLFEQLTKAQQANTSSFSAQASSAYSQSTSPAIRAVDSMPPPQMVPQTMPTVTEELGEPLGAFSQTSMPPTNAASNYVKREQDFGQLSYDRNGLPLSRAHQRHTSMPTYMEYSPAPSFVSSQYEDYSNRGVSYEPLTPPQQAQSLVQEPAYIANEDTGLYTALPDVSASQSYNTMMQLPPSNLSGPQFSGNRGYPNNGVYSVIEGSPTYKQRRRRSSIPAQATGVSQSVTSNGQTHAPHRQSDLRRSVSLSVGPLAEGEEQEDDSPTGIPNSYINNMQQQKDLLEHLSRHGTPLPTLEGSPAPPSANHLHQQQQDDMPNYQTNGISSQQISNISPTSRSNIGPVRRARSATVMELGPYSQKSHSCPIPSCGRLFKRLEHLKRYVS